VSTSRWMSLREYWAPVSPMPYVSSAGMGAGKNAFMVYGKYDSTFLPALTEQMLAALRRHTPHPRTLGPPLWATTSLETSSVQSYCRVIAC